MIEFDEHINTKKILEGLFNFLLKKGVIRIPDANIIIANAVKPKVKVEDEPNKEE